MYIPLLDLRDKDASLQIAHSPDNKDSVGLKIFAEKNPSPALSISLSRDFDYFHSIVLKHIKRVQESPVDISVPITINKYIPDQKQYKVVAVIVLNKSLSANNPYSMIIKNSSFRHEFMFTMNNNISVGGEKLSEKEKSEIAFDSFKTKFEMMPSILATSRTEYKIITDTTGSATDKKPTRNSFSKPTEDEIDFT